MRTGADSVRQALSEWLESESTAVLIGESVGKGGGHGGTSQGLATLFPGRVIDTPIADRTSFGLALGMALGGRPVAVELSSGRALLAIAEMLADAGRMAGTPFRPALTIRVPVGGEAGPVIDASAGDLLGAIGGLRVVCLTADTAHSVLRGALGSGVTVVLEPRSELAAAASPVPATPIAHRVLSDGSHATLLCWGPGVRAAVQAAATLADEGISVRVIDLVSLSPLDPRVGQHVVDTGRLIAVHSTDSHLAQRVLGVALDEAFLYLESPPGDCAAHPEAILDAVRESVFY